jgi:ABC-type nitrate/sulfonate/bicarbonate transport system permease component
MCIGPIRKFLLIQFPASSSIILTGARLSIGLSYGAVVLAGLLAGTPGLGRDISLASFAGETASVLAYTVVAAFAGLAMFWLLQAIENRIVVWRNVA